MDLNKLEKERKLKRGKHIKDLVTLVKIRKEIRKNNENQLKDELGVERNLEKFHNPVTKKIENYEKSNKDVVKNIQNVLENISFSPLESSRVPEIEYEPFDLGNLFEEKSSTGTQTKLKAKDIVDPGLDTDIDKKLIKDKGFKLPSELWNENLETIKKAIEEAEKIKKTIKPHLASSSSAIVRTKIKEKKKEHEILLEKNQHIYETFGRYVDILNNVINWKKKVGKGIDEWDLLDKLTDKLINESRSRKCVKETRELIDFLVLSKQITLKDKENLYTKFNL